MNLGYILRHFLGLPQDITHVGHQSITSGFLHILRQPHPPRCDLHNDREGQLVQLFASRPPRAPRRSHRCDCDRLCTAASIKHCHGESGRVITSHQSTRKGQSTGKHGIQMEICPQTHPKVWTCVPVWAIAATSVTPPSAHR